MKRKLLLNDKKILIIPIEIKLRELLHKLLLSYRVLSKQIFL